MGMVFDSEGEVAAEARRESFVIYGDDGERVELSYEELPHLLGLCEKLRAHAPDPLKRLPWNHPAGLEAAMQSFGLRINAMPAVDEGFSVWLSQGARVMNRVKHASLREAIELAYAEFVDRLYGNDELVSQLCKDGK